MKKLLMLVCLLAGCDSGRSYDETLSILEKESEVQLAIEADIAEQASAITRKRDIMQGASPERIAELESEISEVQKSLEGLQARHAKQKEIVAKLQAELEAHRAAL